MTPFLNDDFLLRSDVARELYHDFAKPQPIYDYHSHLPAQQIAENRRFENLSEVWLAGDHYKWRAMRWNGVPERFCTGDASPWEKFLAYARTVPKSLRNPLYHWTHLELKFYFGIEELLDETTAESIWHRANEQLADLPVHGLLRKSRVAVSCTTDDPADPLAAHRRIRDESTLKTRVYPTFRPDKAMIVDQPEAFNAYLDKLAEVSGVECNHFAGFLAALGQRHDSFHAIGGRLSDHGMNCCAAEDCTEGDARRSFDAARSGKPVAPADAMKFRSYLMLFFGGLDADKGWTKQLHLGSLRNNNARLLRRCGPDTGLTPSATSYKGNPSPAIWTNSTATTACPGPCSTTSIPPTIISLPRWPGISRDGTVPGKIQFGGGWWFLDQKEGMEWQFERAFQPRPAQPVRGGC